MILELLVYAAIIIPGILVFGRFEEHTPKWRRVLKHGMVLAISYSLWRTVGRPWSWAWLLVMAAIGLSFHLWWTHKHGIHPLTAEPREKYYALRGWKA